MARNENLEAKVREALPGISGIEEKQMFRGTAFILNGKLCISAGDEELMFRINAKLQDDVMQKEGCRAMLRNGKPIKGYVYVHGSGLKPGKERDSWMALALNLKKLQKQQKTTPELFQNLMPFYCHSVYGLLRKLEIAFSNCENVPNFALRISDCISIPYFTVLLRHVVCL